MERITYLQVFGLGWTCQDSRPAAAGPCSATERLAALPRDTARHGGVRLVPLAQKSEDKKPTVACVPGQLGRRGLVLMAEGRLSAN